MSDTSPFGKRMKTLRKAAKLSQERLGVLAGVDEFSASARINQYERSKHEPDFQMATHLAAALNAPVSYLYEPDDELADLILMLHRLDRDTRQQLINGLSSRLPPVDGT
ncbi:helix-turn-helix domain-containing protein [Chitinolyticbacter meiyuanensis]|uniref:helix-turn-helix domain-containing protein n=1 Tax=Chitinolyticbacter meiyuanensis TaxID=682798 RepID=UPI0011E58E71|nr:helix-turn-helix transcriptional regulator [Chitinolyticbacter meiyuanensis]